MKVRNIKCIEWKRQFFSVQPRRTRKKCGKGRLKMIKGDVYKIPTSVLCNWSSFLPACCSVSKGWTPILNHAHVAQGNMTSKWKFKWKDFVYDFVWHFTISTFLYACACESLEKYQELKGKLHYNPRKKVLFRNLTSFSACLLEGTLNFLCRTLQRVFPSRTLTGMEEPQTIQRIIMI